MKVCIVGAGAIGGWIAGMLAEAGHEVSLFARGATLEALRTRGLRVRRGETESIHRLKASNDPADLGKQDCVFIVVKGQSIPSVVYPVKALCRTDSMIVPAVNGIPWWFFRMPGIPLAGTQLRSVDPHGVVSGAFDPRLVIGCVVHASAWTPEPGVVEVQGEDRLILGEPSGETSPRVRALASAFGEAPVKLVVSDNIRRDIWTKLWGNMTMNPLSVLTGATTLGMLSDPDVRELVRSMMLEMQDIGAAIGLPIAMTPEARMDVTRRLGDIKTSMLRDWEAGREIEIAPILGALAEIADTVERPAPYLHAVLELLRLRAVNPR